MAILRWCGNALGDRVAQTVDQFAVNFEAQLDLRDEVREEKRGFHCVLRKCSYLFTRYGLCGNVQRYTQRRISCSF
jgi:hypothetical protein